MKDQVVLFDFDNTLTTTDTTKFLLLSLLIYRPYRIIDIIGLLRTPEKSSMGFQLKKTEIVGNLIKGCTDKQLNEKLWLFKYLVGINYQKSMMEILNNYIKGKFHVIIASATPSFALKKIFKNTDAILLGTEYIKDKGRYTAQSSGGPCFGDNKAIIVSHYLEKNNLTNIKSAYSDHLSDLPFLSLSGESFIACKDGSLRTCKAIDEK